MRKIPYTSRTPTEVVINQEEDIRLIKDALWGDPRDRSDQGVVGDIRAINSAIYGPPEKRNGMMGMLKEGRIIWRTFAVGVAVTVIGAVVVKYFGLG